MPDPYPQRHTGSSPVDVPAIPATVLPGEVIHWHLPIAGFEPVTDESTALVPASTDTVPETPAKTARARSTASEE